MLCAVREPDRHALHEPGRADRDDDRVRSPGADREPLDGADREAEQQRQDDRRDEAEAERVEEEHRRDRGGLAEGEREEVAAEDDDGEADGDDPDERRRGEDRLQVARPSGSPSSSRRRRPSPPRASRPRPRGRRRRSASGRRSRPTRAIMLLTGGTPQSPAAWLVVMSARIADADASSRGTTETMRPAKIVTTTSARSSTSSSSVEEKITAVPLRAASRTRSWISARPPTSTPRVGSSRASSAVPSSCERAAEQDLLLVAAAEAAGG